MWNTALTMLVVNTFRYWKLQPKIYLKCVEILYYNILYSLLFFIVALYRIRIH